MQSLRFLSIVSISTWSGGGRRCDGFMSAQRDDRSSARRDCLSHQLQPLFASQLFLTGTECIYPLRVKNAWEVILWLSQVYLTSAYIAIDIAASASSDLLQAENNASISKIPRSQAQTHGANAFKHIISHFLSNVTLFNRFFWSSTAKNSWNSLSLWYNSCESIDFNYFD